MKKTISNTLVSIASIVLLLTVALLEPIQTPALAQSDPTPTPAVEEEEEAATEPALEEPAPEELTPEEQLAQLASVNPPPALSERPVGITEIPCDVGVPSGSNEVEGETYYCGVFTVPMFWDNPQAGTIDLRFLVARATGDDPQPDPLLFLAGGPGQSSIATALNAYSQIRPTRDIVRMDQRGTGLSQRMGLEECLVLAINDEDAQDEVALLLQALGGSEEEGAPEEEPTDETPDQTTGEISDESGDGEQSDEPPSLLSEEDLNTAVDTLCAREFTATGIDLNAFTTAQSARDIIELVKALAYEGFNLHGISYGTRLAMTVMAELDAVDDAVDDAPALHSVVLDSPFPPSIYLLSSLPHNLHDQVLQLFAECRRTMPVAPPIPTWNIVSVNCWKS